MLGTMQLEFPKSLTFSFSSQSSHSAESSVAVAEKTEYSVLEMDEKYQIEARDPNHHWAPELNKAKEEYLTSEEFKASGQEFSELAFFDWVDATKPTLPKTKYLSTTELEACKQTLIAPNLVVYKNPSEEVNTSAMKMFVMDKEGNFYLHKKVKPTEGNSGFNHSSFFHGGQVAGVGFMHFNENGELIAIDDYSGHYKPKTKQVLNVLHALKENGFDLNKIDFYHRISQDSFDKEIFNAQAWYDENLSLMEKKPTSLKC